MDLGVLLGLPLESIAIRVALAAALATVLVRFLLRSGLRTPGARVATALAPVLAIGAVLLVSLRELGLPTLMFPVDTPDALPIPVSDGYLHFAPMAVPLLVGLWAVVFGTRVTKRLRRARQLRRAAGQALREGASREDVDVVAERLARRLRVPRPRVAVVPTCPGGAYVVGSRRPVLLLSDELLGRLDPDELEGVLAHELAHVRRRDNLVSLVVGAVRDLTFFVPGGGWAQRHLHRERELAADQAAVAVTRRPGALASGLLKVVDKGPDAKHPCAALAPAGTLVTRIEALLDERPPPTRTRRTLEHGGVAALALAAVVLAVGVPGLASGPDGQRDALALVWSRTGGAGSEEATPGGQARAFDVYRRTNLGVDVATGPGRRAPLEPDEHSVENRRSTLRACLAEDACPDAPARRGLGLTPRPTVTVDHELTRRWQASPVVPGERGTGFQVFWLERVS